MAFVRTAMPFVPEVSQLFKRTIPRARQFLVWGVSRLAATVAAALAAFEADDGVDTVEESRRKSAMFSRRRGAGATEVWNASTRYDGLGKDWEGGGGGGEGMPLTSHQ